MKTTKNECDQEPKNEDEAKKVDNPKSGDGPKKIEMFLQMKTPQNEDDLKRWMTLKIKMAVLLKLPLKRFSQP